MAQGFIKFDQDIAHKTVADHHIGLPGRQVITFDVADEVQSALLEKRKAFFTSSFPLPSSAPTLRMPTVGLGTSSRVLGIDRAHDGKVQKLVRPDIHIAAHIHHDGLGGKADKRTAQDRPGNSLHHAQDH